MSIIEIIPIPKMLKCRKNAHLRFDEIGFLVYYLGQVIYPFKPQLHVLENGNNTVYHIRLLRTNCLV